MADTADAPTTLLGHPTGLFTLFFAEMWERFSFYGMRALLVLYMLKGFLAYDDASAYAVYGAYGGLVYATPFLGGMLADRILGARKAVVLGGLLMAAGHLAMTIEVDWVFFVALALLIVGNGFFKPNISAIVGELYDGNDLNRAGGFTIFYMGINLGAAAAPLLCGYVGEVYGWHYGFGLATVGMLIGIAIFVVPSRLAQAFVLLGALATAGGMVGVTEGVYTFWVNVFVATALVIAGVVSFVAIGRGGLADDKGRAPEAARATLAGIPSTAAIVGATLLSVPVFALLVSRHELATTLVSLTGVAALGFILYEAARTTKVERERLFVVLVMMFFSLLFWAFFEQAGSSMTAFADRNVDRVFEEREITEADVGSTMPLELTQEQLGFPKDGTQFTLDLLDAARDAETDTVDFVVTADHLGMGIGGEEVPASVFQSANPIFILIFGPLFAMLWTRLGRAGAEPSTPTKFALGLLQLGLGFGAMWWGATQADARGMVAMYWLLLGYLLHTTGELCLSPVGLGMVTRLSPRRLVSTVMGAWFLATAFSHIVAGLIAALTAIDHGSDGGEGGIPVPAETVAVYGDVFGQIALVAIGSSVLCFALVPFLKRWMHGEQ